MDVLQDGTAVLDALPDASALSATEDVAAFIRDVEAGDWTDAQQRFLVARICARGPGEAARMAGVKVDTVERNWRPRPGFRELEARAAALSQESSVQLARAMYQRAAPLVAMRQIEQAIEDHSDLTDRQLMAQQRAREAVAKGAGIDKAEASSGEVIMDEVAVAVFARLRRPA